MQTANHNSSSRGRPRALFGHLETDLPPSVNHAWLNVAGRGRVRSKEYRQWAERAGWEMKAARLPTICGPTAICIRAGLPSRRRDLDNCIKPLLDALTSFGVIEDDAHVHRVTAEWSAEVAPGRVQLHVRAFSSPQTRSLIASAARTRHAARRSASALVAA